MRKTPLQKMVQSVTGKPIEDLLRELYVDKRYSDQEIAKSLGVTRAVIQQWRTQLGISRDDRNPLQPLIGEPEAAA